MGSSDKVPFNDFFLIALFQNSDDTTRLSLSELVPLEILVVLTRSTSGSLAEISPSVYTAWFFQWSVQGFDKMLSVDFKLRIDRLIFLALIILIEP